MVKSILRKTAKEPVNLHNVSKSKTTYNFTSVEAELYMPLEDVLTGIERIKENVIDPPWWIDNLETVIEEAQEYIENDQGC